MNTEFRVPRSSFSVAVVGVSTRAVAESAARAGFDVVGIDLFGDLDQQPAVRSLSLRHDLGGPFDVWRLVEAARAQRTDAVAYVAPFENRPDAVAALAAPFEDGRSPRLLGNSPDALAAVRDPRCLGVVVARAGATMPETLPPGAQPPPPHAGGGQGRWLRKRRKSGGGLRIEPWTGPVPDDPDWLVQRWVPGAPRSAAFVANGREALVFAVTRQLSGDANFGARGLAYTGNLLDPAPDPALLDRLARLATVLTREFGLVGLNGIDFIATSPALTVLEVNPRYSASMELAEAALGVPLFTWHVAGCRGEPLPALPPRRERQVVGKAIVYARRTVTVGDTRDWSARGRRDVPHPGETIQAGHPVCTVTATGINQTDCYAALLAQAAELRREINDD